MRNLFSVVYTLAVIAILAIAVAPFVAGPGAWPLLSTAQAQQQNIFGPMPCAGECSQFCDGNVCEVSVFCIFGRCWEGGKTYYSHCDLGASWC